MLTSADASVVRSVSMTTRPMRADEKDGNDYHFITSEEFKAKVREGVFLEWEEVYDGILYGTPRAQIEGIIRSGKIALLVIDVQGGRAVKAVFPEAVLVFLVPPSFDILNQRLRNRGNEEQEEIQSRLDKARSEMRFLPAYDYGVENQDGKQQQTVDAIRGIIAAERCRISRWEGS